MSKRFLVFWIGNELYKVNVSEVAAVVKLSSTYRVPFKGKVATIYRGKPYVSLNDHKGHIAIILKNGYFISCDRVERVFEKEVPINSTLPREFNLQPDFQPVLNFDVKPVKFETKKPEGEETTKEKFLVFSTDMGYMALNVRNLVSINTVSSMDVGEASNSVYLASMPRYVIRVYEDGKIYDLWVIGVADFVDVDEVEGSKNPIFKEIIVFKGRKFGVPNIKFLSNRRNIEAIVESLSNLLKEVKIPEIEEAYNLLSKLVSNEK